MEQDKINKSRTPTPSDIKILRYLESGQTINNVECIQRFKNAMLRDAIWRLKGAGYPIIAEWITYKTLDGQPKKFKRYYISEPKIIETGAKTEKALKGTSISGYSKNISAIAKAASLFPEE